MNTPPIPEPFICGPLYWAYWSKVATLGINPLRFAMAIKYWSGFRRPVTRTLQGGDIKGVRIGLGIMGSLGLDSRAARRALRLLEVAGLVDVVRAPGCKPMVALRDRWECGREWERTLYHPIPWAWWYCASPLSGRASTVGLLLWFRVGWEQDHLPFCLGDWGLLGLSRFAVGRGLQALETAGLVVVERWSGASPVVTLVVVA
jgi:DNA-binding transcriptional ArsR family regulator